MQFPLHRDSAAIQFVFFQCKQGHRRNFGWKSIACYLNYLVLNEIYVNWPVLSMLLWLIRFILSNYESFQGNLSFSWAQLKTNISFPEKCNGCMFILWIWIWELSYKHTNPRMRYLCFVSFHEPVDGIEWGSPLGPNGFTEFSAQKFYPNSSNTDRFVLPSNSGNVPCEPRSTQWMPFTCILFDERMSVKCKYSNWIKVVRIPMASRAVNSVVI